MTNDAYTGQATASTPITATGAEVISINAPAGSWVIWAKAGFSAPSPTTIVCTIVGHTANGNDTIDTLTVDADTPLRSLALLGADGFSDTTPVALSCSTTNGVTASMTDAELVAMKVSRIVPQLPGG